MAEKLTDAKIKAIVRPEAGQSEYADAGVPGLRVRIGRSGVKTFILRRRVAGKMKNVTIGRYNPPRFTLDDARRKARSLISDLESGGGALAKIKSTPRSSLTVRAMVSDFIRHVRYEKQNRSWRETERIFAKDILPELGDRLADSVTRADVSRLIDGIARPSAARAAYAQLSSFYSWAIKRLDTLPTHPARDAGRPPKPRARDRILNNDELRALWKATEKEPFPWRAAVKLLILTGTRRDEVFSADRSEFDEAAKLWTIPGERTKNGVEHLVPLSDATLAVFASAPKIGDSAKLFPAQRGGTGGARGYSKLMKRLRMAVEEEIGAPVPHWRLHDIRRTVATGMQRLGARLEVTEAVLNHVSGSRSGIVGVYQRYDFADEKRAVLDAWATEVVRIVRDGE